MMANEEPKPLQDPSFASGPGSKEEREGNDTRSVADNVAIQIDSMKEECHVNFKRDEKTFGRKGMNRSNSNDGDYKLGLDFPEQNGSNSGEGDPNTPDQTFTTDIQQQDNPDDFTELKEIHSDHDQASLCTESSKKGENQYPVDETKYGEEILSVDDVSSWTSSSFVNGTTESSDLIHPLPDGKKNHVFFSYDMADCDWVHSVADRMKELGYICSYHERDFHGGKGVIENIMEHIQWSVKTVLVLSPDFLESSWCQYEMKQGLHASIEEARMLIVPVMVRECEVPDTIRSLTYIDATTGADWWGRFLEAITAEAQLQLTHSRNEITIRPQFENLDYLCEIMSTDIGVSHGLKAPYTPAKITKPGIKISDEAFHEEIRKMNEAMRNRGIWCLTSFSPITTFSLLYCICFMVAIILRADILLAILMPAFSSLVYAFFYMCRVYLVTFWYYDVQQCTSHIEGILVRSGKDKKLAENYSKTLIYNMSEMYAREYQNGTLMYYKGFKPRHVRHVKCLCQYIEDLRSQLLK